MGALIALLVLGVQQAHVHAEVVVQQQQSQTKQQQEKEEEERLNREDLLWQQEILEQQRTKKTGQLAEHRLQLSHLEEHLRQLQNDWQRVQEKMRRLQQRQDQSQDWQQQLKDLEQQIKQAQEQLKVLRQQSRKADQGYAIVVYNGSQGTKRRPIYLECTDAGILIHPGGVQISRDDLAGPGGPGNPLDACLRAIREYLAQQGTIQEEPYPLLLVRPNAVYTYAMAPDSNVFYTDVTIAGSTEGTLTVGGDFCLGFVHLATHAVHHVDVVGGNAQIDVAVNSNYTSLNGMQIIQTTGGGSGIAFCFGDGSGADCPCLNFGGPCHGCANGADAEGGYLETQGIASLSNDTVVLFAKDLVPNLPCLFFSGSNAINGGMGIPFGDGLRCVGNQAVRIELSNADNNGEAWTTQEVSTNGQAYRNTIDPGETVHYQCWYRDDVSSSPCSNSFNATNGYSVVWSS